MKRGNATGSHASLMTLIYSRSRAGKKKHPTQPNQPHILPDVLVERNEEVGAGISQGQINLRLVHLLLGGLHLCFVLCVCMGVGWREERGV